MFKWIINQSLITQRLTFDKCATDCSTAANGELFFACLSEPDHRIDWKILWPINSLVISSEVLLGQIFKETESLNATQFLQSAARRSLLLWRSSCALPVFRRSHLLSLTRLSSAQSAAEAGAAWTRFFCIMRAWSAPCGGSGAGGCDSRRAVHRQPGRIFKKK